MYTSPSLSLLGPGSLLFLLFTCLTLTRPAVGDLHTHVGTGHHGSSEAEGEDGGSFNVEEALFGSDSDFDNGKMTKEQRKEKLLGLAHKYDTNINTVIEMDELVHWITASLKEITDQEAAAFLDELDDNKDKKVDFSEMLKHMHDTTVEEFEKFDASGKDEETITDYRVMVVEKKRFEIGDLDKDGFLNVTEIVAFFDPYDFPYMYDVETERAIVGLDKDYNGKLSLLEFVGGETEEGSTSAHADQEAEFKILDTDHDGQLSLKESVGWALLHTSEQLAVEEAKAIMSKADRNGDNALNIKELLRGEEVFFKSGVMNYGHTVKDEL
ncbi:reticulocalbin-3 [Aplysia californica]|uniref:Reticulocalbin-3 n=1 Tax=Aplysia californica TaxID=6500 RepID=A0ABM0K9C7_APLCA|nr:reticulocalbin-3 [Aplysia californica]XP_005111994.1 reticulocalbin-3 [Aplysia californica]